MSGVCFDTVAWKKYNMWKRTWRMAINTFLPHYATAHGLYICQSQQLYKLLEDYVLTDEILLRLVTLAEVRFLRNTFDLYLVVVEQL